MRIALIGNGNMGKIVYSIAKDQIIKIIDDFTNNKLEDNLNIDVIIDFSNRENIKYIYDYVKRNMCKVVIATTNLTNEDFSLLLELANITAVLYDSNFSYGITMLKKILKDNIELFKNYDVELIERHHKYKKDAPSGTMKSFESIFKDKKIKYNTSVIRAGTIRGEHEVIFYGDDEYIEIKHTALSRKIFAIGALDSAKWLMNKEKGLFSYEDYIFDK